MEKQVYVIKKTTSGEWRLYRLKQGITKEQFLNNNKDIEFKFVKVPSMKSIEKSIIDGVCKTPDGCKVEPDGFCSHGYPSWAILLGLI